MNDFDIDECKRLRKEIFITAYKGGMAHLASSFSALEILYTLYMKGVLKYNVKEPLWDKRDRFVLSKGHGGLALYTVLSEVGFLTKKELHSYLQPNCHIGGEPCMRDLAGIEASTGSLGHGLSISIGMALAQKIDQQDGRTFVLLGDGECQEGSVWEAALSAVAFKLGNLTAIIDSNSLQKTSGIQETLGVVNWKEKWSSFGWDIVEVDGHDTDVLQKILCDVHNKDVPRLVIANTIKGKGVSIMEGNPIWHYKMPSKKELKIFKQELNIIDEELI